MDESPTPLMQVQDLCFGYPQRRLFDQWSVCIGPGVTLVCGDEGSGKTSLLQLLSGDLVAESGQLRIDAAMSDRHCATLRSQVFRTDPRSVVLEQITPQAWMASLHERYPAFDPVLFGHLQQRLSLVEHLHKPMYMLSTGSRRKVWLAAAFASGARVVLIDQPFAALDTPSIGVVTDLLRQAACDRTRACVVADYEPPPGIDIAQTIELR